MQRWHSPFCLALFVALAASQEGNKPVNPSQLPPYDVAEAYEVYAAVLPEDWMWNVQHAETLLIRAETVDEGMCMRPDKESEKLLGGAINDYNEQNRQHWLLQRKFQIEKRYELGSKDEINEVNSSFAKRANPVPSQRIRHVGWIDLSAVGFNADKTVAVVYVAHTCGWLCGGGGFYALEKKDGKWQPLRWSGSTCRWDS